jgi:hypothetical protein
LYNEEAGLNEMWEDRPLNWGRKKGRLVEGGKRPLIQRFYGIKGNQ